MSFRTSGRSFVRVSAWRSPPALRGRIGAARPPAQAQEKVLRAVLHADVRTLDPIWTTQTIAGIHGMLVYDTLFGNDDDMQAAAADGRQVRHQRGQAHLHLHAARRAEVPRRLARHHQGRDRLAQALGARDGVGQRLFSFVDKLEAVDDKTFRMMLKKPYGMVLESLGKTGTSVAVIMREQDAPTDPQQQIKEAIGSGPFKFAKDEWVPGSKTVYLKNPDYVPRPGNEKASSFAGSKFAGVDRIELVWISDPQTAMSALINGEIDFCENPNIDFFPILEKARGVKLMKTGKFDSTHGMIRLNHLHPPFNNVKARQAMYYLINQEDFLRAIVGDPKYYQVCHGLITCGSPLAQRRRQRHVQGVQSEEGAAADEGGRLQRRADHHPGGDRPQHHHAGDPGADPGDARGRPQRRRPVDGLGLGGLAPRQEGAAGAGRLEHLRHHHGRRSASANPVLHTWIGAACDKGLFGWPCDAKIEKLRNAYALRPDRRGEEEDRPRPAGARDRAGGLHPVRPVGRDPTPIAPTGSRASCRTPAWSCSGTSRRSSEVTRSDPYARLVFDHSSSHGV